jgi:hypothetical protein
MITPEFPLDDESLNNAAKLQKFMATALLTVYKKGRADMSRDMLKSGQIDFDQHQSNLKIIEECGKLETE